jgi:cytochrome P450
MPWANLWAFRRDPLRFFTEAAHKYGDVVFYSMGSRRLFLVNNPEYIKDLLVTSNRKFEKSVVLQRSKNILGNWLLTSEGDFHLRQRRLAQPAFHRHRVNSYGKVMVEYAQTMCARWQDGSTIDVHDEMMKLTLAIVGKTLFDAEMEGKTAEEIAGAMQTFMDLFGLVFLPYSQYLEKFNVPPMNRIHKARRQLDGVVYRLIAERRSSGRDQGDLLSMLLRASDPEGDGSGMTDEQLRDECVTLILAGHETTANALSWTWMLLSQNPEIERRMHEEIATAIGDRPPTVEDIPALRYVEWVLAESMRLYPPAWVIGRRAIEAHQFGGYEVPAGCMVLCSQWVMHRDERYYVDPKRFDPERWRPEERVKRPKFSYFPFGAGPRQCIGEPFAWMEGVLLLASIAQRWRMRLVPEHPVSPLPVITLRPKYGIRVKLEERAAG